MGRERDDQIGYGGFDPQSTLFFIKQMQKSNRGISPLDGVLKRKHSTVQFSVLREQDHSILVYCEMNPTGREQSYERNDI